MNEDITIMDAEMSQSSGLYDINAEVSRLYDFNLDDSQDMLVFPEMAKRHRGVIFDLTKKYGLQYISGPKKSEDPEAFSAVTVKKSKGYKRKVWPSPFGPETNKKKNYDKVPVGHSLVLNDFLFLGSGRDADAIESLQQDRITAVLNVTAEWKESPRFRETGILFRRIVIKDFVTESIAAHFEEALSFMDSVRAKNERVLCHCVIGKSRSASVVLAYLMTREKMTLRESLDHVWRSRPMVRPNDTFFEELLVLEEKLFGKRSISVADLPAMKDPGSSKGPKGAKDAESVLIRECLTEQRLVAIEKEAKNLNSFLKAVNAEINRDCADQIKASGLGEKRISKLINRTATDWWKSKK